MTYGGDIRGDVPGHGWAALHLPDETWALDDAKYKRSVQSGPITGQYSGHVISVDQWEDRCRV